MRYPRITVLPRITMLLLLVLGWFACVFWLLTDSSILHHPLLASLVLGLPSMSVLLVLLGSQWRLQQEFCPRPLEHDSHERFSFVARILHHQAGLLNVPCPVLYLYDSDKLNAFIVGGIWQQQHLYLSEALVKQLSRDEIEAVIAHELAHVYHQDIVVNEIFFGMSMVCIALLEHSIGRAMALFVNKEDRAELAKQIAVIMTYGGLLLPLWLMMLLYSRRSEYRADALASQLVGSQQFICLLHRLKGVCRDHFFNLDGPQVLLRHYFTSHPPIHHRINALQARQQA